MASVASGSVSASIVPIGTGPAHAFWRIGHVAVIAILLASGLYAVSHRREIRAAGD